MDLSYTAAQEVDAEQIYTLCKQLVEDYETDPIPMDKVLAWCRRKIEENLAEYRVICCDGEKAGYLRISPQEDGTLELDDFYVLEGFRGKGIGSAVLHGVCRKADEEQTPLLLYVFKKNEGAHRLYQRFGFVVTSTAGNSRYIMQRTPK